MYILYMNHTHYVYIYDHTYTYSEQCPYIVLQVAGQKNNELVTHTVVTETMLEDILGVY